MSAIFVRSAHIPQLRTFVCALTVFSTCGVKAARMRKPLHNWALYKNIHNRRRAIELLHKLDAIRTFRAPNETVEIFFQMFNYGSSAMTLRGGHNKCGGWEDGQEMTTNVVSGVHADIHLHFTRCGFIWRVKLDTIN